MVTLFSSIEKVPQTISQLTGLSSLYQSKESFSEGKYKEGTWKLTLGTIQLAATSALIFFSTQVFQSSQTNNFSSLFNESLEQGNIKEAFSYLKKLETNTTEPCRQLFNACLDKKDTETALKVVHHKACDRPDLFYEWALRDLSENRPDEAAKKYSTAVKSWLFPYLSILYGAKDRPKALLEEKIVTTYLQNNNTLAALNFINEIHRWKSDYEHKLLFRTVFDDCVRKNKANYALETFNHFKRAGFGIEVEDLTNELSNFCFSIKDKKCLLYLWANEPKIMNDWFETHSFNGKGGLDEPQLFNSLHLDIAELKKKVSSETDMENLARKCSKLIRKVHPDKSGLPSTFFSGLKERCVNYIQDFTEKWD